MSKTTKRLLLVQHAGAQLGFEMFRTILRSLEPADKIMVLAIVLDGDSSETNNEKKQEIEDRIKKKNDEYSNCKRIAEIRILAAVKQVGFEIAVDAGSLNDVVFEYAKKFEATRVSIPGGFPRSNPIMERLLGDKQAEDVCGPQLSSILANQGKGPPNIRPLAEDPPEKISSVRGSDKSSTNLLPKKSPRFRRLKRASPSCSPDLLKKQKVEAEPCIGKKSTLSDEFKAGVTETVRKICILKRSEKIHELDDREVKNKALSNLIKALVYAIEENKRSCKLLSKTEGSIDENAKLLEKIAEMQDEVSNLNSLKSEMQTKLNKRDARIVKLKAKIKTQVEETEMAKKEATEVMENFKDSEEYTSLRDKFKHQGAKAMIGAIAAARPEYDLSFLYSSDQDEDEEDDKDSDEDEEDDKDSDEDEEDDKDSDEDKEDDEDNDEDEIEMSSDEDLEDWITAENCWSEDSP